MAKNLRGLTNKGNIITKENKPNNKQKNKKYFLKKNSIFKSGHFFKNKERKTHIHKINSGKFQKTNKNRNIDFSVDDKIVDFFFDEKKIND